MIDGIVVMMAVYDIEYLPQLHMPIEYRAIGLVTLVFAIHTRRNVIRIVRDIGK